MLKPRTPETETTVSFQLQVVGLFKSNPCPLFYVRRKDPGVRTHATYVGTSRSRGRGGGTKMPVTFVSPRRVILLLDKFPPRFFSKHRCSFSLPVISAPVTRCAPKKTFLVSKTLKPGFTSPCNRPAASILQRRLRPSPPLHFTPLFGGVARIG